ncbi:hypothetical protein [Paenibacillus sp. GXUN7292]|uniref:hypothetical protein n=1 Tax=Paenibacillus sp. GXUN7292 TaxID=3422499 RepID=UPI003D7C761A
MKSRIRKSVIAAWICFGSVAAGYQVYASLNNKVDTGDHYTEHYQLEPSDNEVTADAFYLKDELLIELKDFTDQAPELEPSHDKLMHVIVVSSDLQQYFHLHPEKQRDGIFSQKINLKDNVYNVFVDIKPKNLNYVVEPIQIHVGDTDLANNDAKLIPDTQFTKMVNAQAIELKMESDIQAHKEVTLDFDMLGGKPQPYLGALGHVVILDGSGENFVHVHPISSDKTVFHTHFHKPGLYKIWAEFKFNDQVNVYPYIINVT